jgi:Family of unknown function (DUF6088)
MNDKRFISTNDKIVSRLQSSLPGSIVFVQDFLSEGSPEAIRQQLSRLAKDGLLIRLSHGIYVVAKKLADKFLMPAGEEIALAIARRDKARVMPTGVVSLWKLGLSTQVPLNYVYLTDGPSRLIKIVTSGMKGYTIKFKHASPKNFALRGKISSQVVSALKSLGEKNLSEDVIEKVKSHIMRENLDDLNHDLSIAPAWISKLLKQSFDTYKHEGLDSKERSRKV